MYLNSKLRRIRSIKDLKFLLFLPKKNWCENVAKILFEALKNIYKDLGACFSVIPLEKYDTNKAS